MPERNEKKEESVARRAMLRVKRLEREAQGYSELIEIYSAWLGYLLAERGASELRVRAEDIKESISKYSCRAVREGDEYVISVTETTKAEEDEAVMKE